jgi:hypothetical protein
VRLGVFEKDYVQTPVLQRIYAEEAMNHWTDRVPEACKENKSYAIAHGREEWY